ncbi:hypothetical protein BKA70DRAFT_1215062 [Coprinopsis sp. MPI-PUGE-AT-0042]|nr:hypothetical protein BKA70DRAFT_1215062 [Coprinopsis sp. MPI-PUGE-AT-0042]
MQVQWALANGSGHAEMPKEQRQRKAKTVVCRQADTTVEENGWTPGQDLYIFGTTNFGAVLLNDISVVSRDVRLQFRSDPSAAALYRSDWLHEESFETVIPNTGRHSLVLEGAPNRNFLQVEFRLWSLYRTLASFERTEARLRLEEKILASLKRVDREKETEWNRQRRLQDGEQRALVYPNGIHMDEKRLMHPTYKAVALACLVMHVVFFTPRRAMEVNLAGIRDILRISNAPEGHQ